jgi:hypothetical protein
VASSDFHVDDVTFLFSWKRAEEVFVDNRVKFAGTRRSVKL